MAKRPDISGHIIVKRAEWWRDRDPKFFTSSGIRTAQPTYTFQRTLIHLLSRTPDKKRPEMRETIKTIWDKSKTLEEAEENIGRLLKAMQPEP